MPTDSTFMLPLFAGLTRADGVFSSVGQLGSVVLAVVIGRTMLRSRALILLACVAGTGLAMTADIMADGQGAFLWLFVTPVAYYAAVGGRDDLRRF